ncbi:hypothetical protein LR48_Vigan02g105400 [Vigna angularis]|uniref:Uncharacterized protein n=1 Tax=Phaseolus angularis TaxID=3914 RepID=A0A0L9TXJ9_PHAAN|nr:hypothetical protein LR48_Vigan02g105400 [Vigna angularis]
MSQETLRQMDLQKAAFHDETPTPPRVSTRGSCSAVDPIEYSSQYELLVDGDPPRIVAVERVLEGGQTIHGVAILPQHFTRPQKQPIHDTIIHEIDEMAEAEDDPLSKLMTKLPRLKKASLELYWDLRVFGLPPHVPVYITFSYALEVIRGDRMLNISIIQLSHWQLMVIIPKQCKIIWFCSLHRRMKHDLRTMLQGVIGKSRGQLVQILYPKVIKTIIRAVITDDWNERFKSTSPILEDTIKQIRQEWIAYLLQRWS